MWTKTEAMDWGRKHPGIIGFNYVPGYAVNSTEMWQAECFALQAIRRELTAAAEVGYNACRVFLPWLLWEAEHDAFLKNLEDFLETARSLGIFTAPVLFDDCAFSHREPGLGAQPEPVKGIHNSGWTPSPGFRVSDDPAQRPRLEAYVRELLTVFGTDERILFWDLYNEPGNSDREEKCGPLLQDVFRWARQAAPSQPLTACVWACKPFDLACLELSDVISYHDYQNLEESRKRAEEFLELGRPVFCTEWLHREVGSCMETHLPYFCAQGIGTFQWGLVKGRTQTNLNWDPEKNCFDGQPEIWQHDIFYPDLTPYRPEEMEIVRAFRRELDQK